MFITPACLLKGLGPKFNIVDRVGIETIKTILGMKVTRIMYGRSTQFGVRLVLPPKPKMIYTNKMLNPGHCGTGFIIIPSKKINIGYAGKIE